MKRDMEEYLTVELPTDDDVIQTVEEELLKDAMIWPGGENDKSSVRFMIRESKMKNAIDVCIKWTQTVQNKK